MQNTLQAQDRKHCKTGLNTDTGYPVLAPNSYI